MSAASPIRSPTPADNDLTQVRRFLRRTEESVCDRVQPTAHGAAMLTPSLSLVWQLNAIHVDDPDADTRLAVISGPAA